MFYAACEGYFDKEESEMLLARKVARAACMSDQAAFDNFWPLNNTRSGAGKSVVWGSKEDAEKLRSDIEKAHGIKLS